MGRGSVQAIESAAAGEEEEKYAFHSFGAQFCELKVNRWTGEVRLQRITSVMDIGTVIIPTNADVPDIDVHFIIKPDTIFNPLGARGIGEIGITGMPAAIANAVFNATGRRVREFPIRLEKLLPLGSDQPAISMSGV